jgi:hypothetical protein
LFLNDVEFYTSSKVRAGHEFLASCARDVLQILMTLPLSLRYQAKGIAQRAHEPLVYILSDLHATSAIGNFCLLELVAFVFQQYSWQIIG